MSVIVEPGVYVKSLKPGSPADESGLLLPYDRIMKVCEYIYIKYCMTVLLVKLLSRV